MNIYLYDDYKLFLKEFIEEQQKKGRGYVGKISTALNLHISHVSAVINGEKDFTFEQFYSLARFLELSDQEADYLMQLAQYSRAGTHEYRQYLREKLLTSQEQGLKNQKNFSDARELSTEEKGVFYSSWLFSAVHLYCSTSNGRTFEEIQNRFNLDREKLEKILQFLLNAQLCRYQEERYMINSFRTVITSSSPLWAQHHKNWRLKSIQKSENVSANEILYTSAVTLSAKDFNIIRDEILLLLKSLSKKVEDSPPEELACLNIDWFLIR